MSKPARSRQINRAEVVDQNFIAHVTAIQNGHIAVENRPGPADADLLEMFDSQMASRQLDLMARIKRQENKVFYTIGSSGHEGNAMVGRLTRATDPAFLHYRSGAFLAERYRKGAERPDFIRDTCLSFAAARDDVASGGRHKVWGHPDLWVLPQTSTIASHLPKAMGAALALESGRGGHHELPVPDDSIMVCSFGDASLNHATAQAAFNACAWAHHQNLPVPVLFVCEDNDIGISVPTPANWVADSMRNRHGISYHYANGLDLVDGYAVVEAAVADCRRNRRPVFLHLKTTRLMGHAGPDFEIEYPSMAELESSGARDRLTAPAEAVIGRGPVVIHLKTNRLMGHAGTDFEIEYRSMAELEAAEARDPLKTTAEAVIGRGLMTPEQVLQRYRQLSERCLAEADRADGQGRLTTLEEVMAPLAPFSPDEVAAEAGRSVSAEKRLKAFGGEQALPENQPPRHMAVQINRALTDLLIKYPQALAFGEDVGRKGGVYTVTRGLSQAFGPRRVFNTLLDETTILGLAQGYGIMGWLPIPEIQYLAYFHNAGDQIRGEACSLQYFSNGAYSNPMV